MQIDVITIFPEMFESPFSKSIIKRALDAGNLKLNVHNLRQWTTDRHQTVDAPPYGGGPGMVMMVEPIYQAVSALRTPQTRVLITSAKGKTFTQAKAQALTQFTHLLLICGHYEGIDQRVYDHIADEALSIGDYVLTGGELPAMVMIDAVTRLLPGVVGSQSSLVEESHSRPGYIEYPQYTRPQQFLDWVVPEVLLSGNHAEIKSWRDKNSKSNS